MASSTSEVVPAYWATSDAGHSVPLIVCLLFLDGTGRSALPDAVLRSIDKTVDATDRTGLAMATVADNDEVALTVGRWMERALALRDVIVLLKCQSEATAHRVMDWLHKAYTLSLVRDRQQ